MLFANEFSKKIDEKFPGNSKDEKMGIKREEKYASRRRPRTWHPYSFS